MNKKIKSSENETFNAIKEIYFTIDKNYDELFEKCKSGDTSTALSRQKQLKSDYVTARANYRRSINLNFEANEPMIKETTEKLIKVAKRIEKDIKAENITGAVFKAISEGVKLASMVVVVVMDLM